VRPERESCPPAPEQQEAGGGNQGQGESNGDAYDPGENLTLRTLVSLATALDGRFEVQFRPYKPSDSYAGHGAGDENI